MITSLVVKNSADSFGSSLALDTIDGNGVGYPLTEFSWHNPTDGADLPKMQSSGTWPWRKDIHKMPIIVSGRILARTTSEYWTQRKALMAKLLPGPNNSVYDPIKFELQLDGDSTVYFAFCVLIDFSAPLTVDEHVSTVSSFSMEYECRAGYWSSSTGLVIL